LPIWVADRECRNAKHTMARLSGFQPETGGNPGEVKAKFCPKSSTRLQTCSSCVTCLP